MKYLFVMSIGLITASCASFKPITTPEKSFEQIYEFPGLSKDELYLRANTWFVRAFKDAESVIQFSDKEEGRIAGRYIIITDRQYYDGFEFGDWIKSSQVVLVDIKESRIRIEISQPTFDPPHTALTYYDRKFNIQGDVIDLRPMWDELAKSLYTYVSTEDPTW